MKYSVIEKLWISNGIIMLIHFLKHAISVNYIRKSTFIKKLDVGMTGVLALFHSFVIIVCQLNIK